MGVGRVCCVLIPCGRRSLSQGAVVDFDAVYQDLIAPAVEAVGLIPCREAPSRPGHGDDESGETRGLLCLLLIGDLAGLSPAALYRIGRRDGTGVPTAVFTGPVDESLRAPAGVRVFRYVTSAEGRPVDAVARRAELAAQLRTQAPAETGLDPVTLLQHPAPPLPVKPDAEALMACIPCHTHMRERLALARQSVDVVGALREVAGSWESVQMQCPGCLLDLLFSYRSAGAWGDMVELAETMPLPLRGTALVREQLALAFANSGQPNRATALLAQVIAELGPNSETCGLLGRLYKDQWEVADRLDDPQVAAERLERALEAYIQGFEADWRDPYPGINAATLMEIREPPDARLQEVLGAVAYAARRRIAAPGAHYWDVATLLEAAVLARDRPEAEHAAVQALALVTESWEAATTARNLRFIAAARERRGERLLWAEAIEKRLETRALK